MSFFDEDARPRVKIRSLRSRPEYSEAMESPEAALMRGSQETKQGREIAILVGEAVGVLIGVKLYQRLGAPKWAAYAIVGIELRLARIVRAVS